MEIKYYNSLHEDAKFIRSEVFVKEQGFQGEFDNIDKRSIHVVVYNNNKPCAAGRAFLKDEKDKNTWIIGRISVLKEYRLKGVGSIIMKALEDKIYSQGGKVIELSSQETVKEFYEKLGYTPYGSLYYDEHILHIKMFKKEKV